MNKKEIVRQIRDVVKGSSPFDYIVVNIGERSWKIVDKGIGKPSEKNDNGEDILFCHDRNNCTFKEAEYLLDSKIREMLERRFRLTIELVPYPSHYNGLSHRLPKKEWDKIRKATYAKYGNKCGICGAEGRLNCHEIWEYDDEKHIQKLEGLIALCNKCHFVKHLDFGRLYFSKDFEKDQLEIMEHFMEINDCNWEIFDRYYSAVSSQCEKRSEYEWQVDFGEYKKYITSKKVK